MKRVLAAVAVFLLCSTPAGAQDKPRQGAMKEGAVGCDAFGWDVKHELAVLGMPARAVTAGTDGKKPIHLDLDQHYTVKLAPQSSVNFAVKPAKAELDDNAHAGVVSFHTPKAGRYRISITTDHWLDVLDGPLLVVSQDFQGQRACEKVHKIVQYELSGNKEFVLQLSGGAQSNVELAITPVKPG